MKLIVGLGNPGDKYKFTRHNFGSLVVEALAQKAKKKFKYSFFAKSRVSELNRSGEKVLLLLPASFMNLSGRAIAHVVKNKRLDLKDILVVCDDINLELGKLRARASGSDGGHNGLKSAVDCLGTEGFARLRLGIGSGKSKELVDFVLSEFDPDEKKMLGEITDKAIEAIYCWLDSGINVAMNKYN